MPPLVTALIATRNRHPELELTLRQLRQLDYPNLDLLVIDDASDSPVEPIVRVLWPEARVIRHESNTGQCQRRSEGFLLASGEYILHLDDDCGFVDPAALTKAVAALESRPHAGVLAPFLFNGLELPADPGNASLQPGIVASFVGAAALLRTAAVRQTAGYRTFFSSEWEEEELCLQLLSLGYCVWFDPSLLAHHRLSALNRNTERSWMRGLRNRSWAILIHMPWSRVPLELAWKFTLGAWDAIRLGRPRSYLQSCFQFLAGAANALRLRRPLPPVALRRYDAIRSYHRIDEAVFANPPAAGWRDLAAWWRRWRNRARDRNKWDKTPGGTGSSYNVGYAHEQRKPE
jgi:GT2 family glycosyltransferase